MFLGGESILASTLMRVPPQNHFFPFTYVIINIIDDFEYDALCSLWLCLDQVYRLILPASADAPDASSITESFILFLSLYVCDH